MLEAVFNGAGSTKEAAPGGVNVPVDDFLGRPTTGVPKDWRLHMGKARL